MPCLGVHDDGQRGMARVCDEPGDAGAGARVVAPRRSGLGIPEKQADEAWKTVHYPNGGNPLTVTYHNGKATEVKQGKAS